MTQLHSNADSGIDPELLFAMIDDMASPDAASSVSTSRSDSPDPAELGRTVGRVVGRSVGGAMGAEIGAVLAPLFAGINDLEELYSGTGETRETRGEAREARGEVREAEGSYGRRSGSWSDDSDADPDSDSDAGTGAHGDAPADGRAMTRDDEPGHTPEQRGDGSRLVDDDYRRDDGPAGDEDDERDAWGRRDVGIHWPLPPESRLPMDS